MKNKGKVDLVLMNLKSWYFKIKRTPPILSAAKPINSASCDFMELGKSKAEDHLALVVWPWTLEIKSEEGIMRSCF